jgi:hypothetical protein
LIPNHLKRVFQVFASFLADASGRVFAVTTSFEASEKAFDAIRADCTRKTYLQQTAVALLIWGHPRACPPFNTRKLASFGPSGPSPLPRSARELAWTLEQVVIATAIASLGVPRRFRVPSLGIGRFSVVEPNQPQPVDISLHRYRYILYLRSP